MNSTRSELWKQRASSAAIKGKAAARKASEQAQDLSDRAKQAPSSVSVQRVVERTADAAEVAATSARRAADRSREAALKAQPHVQRAANQARDAATSGVAATHAAATATRGAADKAQAATRHRRDVWQTKQQYRQLGGRYPRTAWLLWTFLGLVGAHRVYLKSIASGAIRLATTIGCWLLAYFAAQFVFPSTGLRTVVSLARDDWDVGQTAQGMQQRMLIMVGIMIVGIVAPFVLWLLDIPWVARTLRRRNTTANQALRLQTTATGSTGQLAADDVADAPAPKDQMSPALRQ